MTARICLFSLFLPFPFRKLVKDDFAWKTLKHLLVFSNSFSMLSFMKYYLENQLIAEANTRDPQNSVFVIRILVNIEVKGHPK